MQSMLFLTALALLLSAPLHNTIRVSDNPGDSIDDDDLSFGEESLDESLDSRPGNARRAARRVFLFDGEDSPVYDRPTARLVNVGKDDDDEGVPSAFDDEFGEESLDSRPVLTRALGTRSLEPLSVDDEGDEDPGDSIVWDSPFYERPPARLVNVGKDDDDEGVPSAFDDEAGSQRPSLQRMGGQRHLDQVAILCDADGVKEFLHQHYQEYKKENEKAQATLHFKGEYEVDGGAAVDDVTVSDDRKHATATLTWSMENDSSHTVQHSVPFTLVCEKDTWTQEKRQAAFGEPVAKPEAQE